MTGGGGHTGRIPLSISRDGQVVAGSSGLEEEVSDLRSGALLGLRNRVGEGEAEHGREKEECLHHDEGVMSCRQC